MPALYASLKDDDSVMALATRFAIVTAARTVEVRYARWEHIDADNRVWIVPEENSKTGREHVVPLSEEALEILSDARRLPAISKLVFSSPLAVDGTVSRKAMSQYFKRRLPDNHGEATLQGTARGTFSTWAYESGRYRADVIETCLAHQVGTEVSRSYNRATYANERRQLMEDWARALVAKTDIATNKPDGGT